MSFQKVLIFCVLQLAVAVNGAMKSVCYTNGGGLAASNFNPAICTHIIHTFLQLDSNGNLVNPQSVTAYLASLVSLKSQNSNLKILIAFGGASGVNNADWSALVANPSAISNFATQALNFVKANKIDGVDLDWEYPETSADKTGFGSLLKQLRITFGSSFLVSAALGASIWRAGVSYDLPAIFGACDFVNMMTYDFNGWQSTGRVGHNAPLYGRSDDTGDQIGNNIDTFMNSFVTLNGVVKSKIILGIPTYGKVFTLTSSATAVFSSGFPSGNEEYNSICGKVNSRQYTSVLDNDRKAAYAFGGQTWVGYESPASAAIKAQYIKDKALGGAMFWSLNGDDYSNSCGGGKSPIITTVFNIINGGTAPITQPPAVTTKTTTTKAPGSTFVCPGSGLFKNPADCTTFYNCANGVAYLMACSGGLRFNSAISACDWSYNVVC